MPITERQLVSNLQNFSKVLYAQVAEDTWEKHEEAAASYVDLKWGLEDFINTSFTKYENTDAALRNFQQILNLFKTDHNTGLRRILDNLKEVQDAVKEDPALNKKVLETIEAYTKNSTNLTELLTLSTPSSSVPKTTLAINKGEKDDMVTKEAIKKEPTKKPKVENVKKEPESASRLIPITIVIPVTKPAPELEMIGSSSRIQLTDTILEVPIPQPTGPVIVITPHEQPKSPQVTPNPDRGKGKVTDDVESPPKLIKASSKVHPVPDEPVRVPFEINGKLYHLTNEEIQVHYELEKRKQNATEEAKLLEMNNLELIKVVHEEAAKAGVDPKILASAKGGTGKKNFDVHNPFNFDDFDSKRYEKLKTIPDQLGIRSNLCAPGQVILITSRRKRKIQELEHKARIPGLECNRSLHEGVPFVNNMVIEEPDYGCSLLMSLAMRSFKE
ncbi:hypothetical protein Tco_1284078 [Tanacetum coccineum]